MTKYGQTTRNEILLPHWPVRQTLPLVSHCDQTSFAISNVCSYVKHCHSFLIVIRHLLPSAMYVPMSNTATRFSLWSDIFCHQQCMFLCQTLPLVSHCDQTSFAISNACSYVKHCHLFLIVIRHLLPSAMHVPMSNTATRLSLWSDIFCHQQCMFLCQNCHSFLIVIRHLLPSAMYVPISNTATRFSLWSDIFCHQ